MFEYKKIIIFVICLLLFVFLFPDIVFSQSAKQQFSDSLSITALGTGHADIQSDASLPKTIGRMIQILLSFMGVIFMILIIYGGFIWMTARGNEQAIEKAKKTIGRAIIGVFIIAVAYTLTLMIGRVLTE